MMIKDPYGRLVDNLRLSVTQRCDLNCFYCHREGETSSLGVEMTPEEIERVVRIAVSFNIKKVKVTGGEPLLRADIIDIIRRLNCIPHIDEIAMTTNGIRLKNLARFLSAAGLARVNVSLGSLNPACYSSITGVDGVSQALGGIKEAIEVGLSPVKVNMVVLKGINDDQVPVMIDFARANRLILQLIEFESSNIRDGNYTKYHFDLAEIEKELKEQSSRIVIRTMQKRRKYFLCGGGEIEVVRPMHNTVFCRHCRRLRVTSDGKFKPCLFVSDNLIDFLTPMRNGAMDEEIKILLLKAVEKRRPYFI